MVSTRFEEGDPFAPAAEQRARLEEREAEEEAEREKRRAERPDQARPTRSLEEMVADIHRLTGGRSKP
jgi:hypothetical protein